MKRLFAAVMLAVLAAPVLTWFLSGNATPFRYLAADAFYYLTIAAQSQDRWMFTYDGLHPTNGFHPLWQVFLRLVFALPRLQSPDARIWFSFGTSLVLTASGLGCWAVASARVLKSRVFGFFGVMPGPYYLLFIPWERHMGSPWSFANGMETGLTLFFSGLLALRCSEPRKPLPGPAMFSGCLTVLVLARLDDVFLFPPFFVALALSENAPWKTWVKVLVPPTAILSAYLIINRFYAGTAFPSSGSLKSGWALPQNLAVITSVLEGGPIGFRHLQLGVPVILALAALVPAWIHRDDPWWKLCGLYALYVLGKGGYNLLFVHFFHQGHWYFPLSILYCNLLMAGVAGRAFARARKSGIKLPNPIGGVAVALTLAVAVTVHFGRLKAGSAYQENFHRLVTDRTRIAAGAERWVPGGILEFDDGVIAFALGFPTMNGFGLALDAQALDARRRGNLLELAHDRGFTVLASLDYFRDMPMAAVGGDTAILQAYFRRNFWFLKGQNPARFDFKPVYRDSASGLMMVAFSPRLQGATIRPDQRMFAVPALPENRARDNP